MEVLERSGGQEVGVPHVDSLLKESSLKGMTWERTEGMEVTVRKKKEDRNCMTQDEME